MPVRHTAPAKVEGAPRRGSQIFAMVLLAWLLGSGRAAAQEQPQPPAAVADKVSDPTTKAGRVAGKATPNRLAQETSPYLQLHQNNPVAWHPWGEEALALAKKLNKPIFLSIGYSSCHWCHVMNRESFANTEIARYLNEHFICIKVDREERPDVDQVYMEAVQALNDGHGGWPLSAFLLPDGRPFFGGTYFPPTDRRDEKGQLLMIGFPTLLKRVVDVYSTQLPNVEKQADALHQYLQRTARVPTINASPLTTEVINEALAAVIPRFDPRHGGFGMAPRWAPKFPQPTVGLFVVEAAGSDVAPVKPILYQAERMARGGIYDQVGGGFHRYSVDREWVVPHFEKMLYDQAQLLSLYSRLHMSSPNPEHARVVAETIAFVERELTSPEGLFYSALDADSEHEEGKFYVWSRAELKQVLGADYPWVAKLTGAAGEPNFEGKYILLLSKTLDEVAKEENTATTELAERWLRAKAKMLEFRAQRVRPLLDTKIITSWNALMVVGLVDAALTFGDDHYKRLALRAIDQMLLHLRQPSGKLCRHRIGKINKGTGYADDYAATVLALLAIYRLDPNPKYLDAAHQMMKTLLDQFWDEKGKGFFYTGKSAESLVARLKETHDGALPGSNSLAALALVGMASLPARPDNPNYRAYANETLQTFGRHLREAPAGVTTMLRALHLHLHSRTPPIAADIKKDTEDEAVEKIEVTPTEATGKPGAQVEIEVKITLAKGWHINANPASPDYLKPTTLKVQGKSPLRDVKITYPEAKELRMEGMDEPVLVYEGKPVLKLQANVAENAATDSHTVELLLEYQACDDKRCLPPKKKKLNLKVVVKN